MKLLSLLLAPAFLAWTIQAEIQILPPMQSMVFDLTSVNPSQPSSVVFTCMADGDVTGLEWQDNNNRVINATEGDRAVIRESSSLGLRLKNIDESFGGLYTCIGIVNGQREEDNIRLQVYRGITFTSPDKQYPVRGTDAKIWCRIEATTLSRRVSWYILGEDGASWIRIRPDQNDRYVTGSDEGDYLMVRNITLEDSHTYICNMDVREVGRSHAHLIDVVVTVPPKMTGPITLSPTTPVEGDRLLLTCRADGIPAPTYMFRKDGQDLLEDPNTDGHFEFDSVSRNDEGLYECEASSVGGVATNDMTLDVKIPPAIEDRANISQREGTEVRFACVATGDEAPSMFWRRKGDQLDFLPNADGEIYVEEATDNPDQDGVTKVYTRTLYLVIPSLQSQHAGEYVCKASNDAGEREKTFKIDVTFKPNFNNQEVASFYGWVGGRTNLTCIANGNPKPFISWFRNDQDLSNFPGYTISIGQSGIATRAISYLVPTIDNNNVGTVFGDYQCRASNEFETADQTLTLVRAVPPAETTVSLVMQRPTEIELRLTPPTNDGGQPVKKYLLKYKVEVSSEDPLVKEINRFPGEGTTDVTLDSLVPNTKYFIRIYAINDVGQGDEKEFKVSTADYSIPDPVEVVSNEAGMSANSYVLRWSIPMTGGAEIVNYNVVYTEVLEVKTSAETGKWTAVRESPNSQTKRVDGEGNTQLELTGLKRGTYYKVQITAVNRIGSSDATTFIFQTGQQVGPTGRASCVRASVTGLGLVVVAAYLHRLLC